MFRNVLVPLDGSAFGEHALPLALSVARRAGATLHVMHVHTPLAAVYLEGAAYFDESLEGDYKRHQEDYLGHVVRRVKDAAPVNVTPVLAQGDVGQAIEDTAARAGADLIVMTTHGRGPVGRFWLGSVTDELVRHCAVPLLLVRPHEAVPDLKQEHDFKHVLVPLDGSPPAERILGPATALGALGDADYTLLRMIHPVLPGVEPPSGTTMNERVASLLERVEKAHQELKAEALKYLEGVAAPLRGRGLRVQTRVTAERQAAEAVLHAAAPPIDLIAMETHGRGGLSRLFVGSVADKVLRGAQVPMLVQRLPRP